MEARGRASVTVPADRVGSTSECPRSHRNRPHACRFAGKTRLHVVARAPACDVLNSRSDMTLRFLPVLALTTLVAASGCTADAADEEDEDGDSGETDENTEALTTPCALSRAHILGSVTGGRKRALERGFRWYDRNVQYSQTGYFEGYRRDCSGFVSMAWELGRSYTTYTFMRGSAPTDFLSSYDSLLPGDALVMRANGRGHMVMFAGWNDSGKTSACVLEEASTALDMEFRARTRTSLRNTGYKAIRADKF